MARIDLDLAHAYKPDPKADADYALLPLKMSFRDGGAYALLGPSGCGKTTMLNIMSGLLVPSQGTVQFDGVDVIDTTKLSAHELQHEIRERFTSEASPHTTVSITSFGFSRGVPHNADLVFDLRFLRNPHWDNNLRPMTGLDQAVSDYVEADPAYEDAVTKIRDLLLYLLPLYDAQGKAYVNIAFGCTGGRHRSVHVAEQFGKWLRDAGFSPTVAHRNLTSRAIDALEGPAGSAPRHESKDKQGSN